MKKRNEEEKIFKNFREAYGLHSSGTVEEIKKFKEKTEIPVEKKKKKKKENGIDEDTESKNKSKGSVELKKPDGKNMPIAEPKNKRKMMKQEE